MLCTVLLWGWRLFTQSSAISGPSVENGKAPADSETEIQETGAARQERTWLCSYWPYADHSSMGQPPSSPKWRDAQDDTDCTPRWGARLLSLSSALNMYFFIKDILFMFFPSPRIFPDLPYLTILVNLCFLPLSLKETKNNTSKMPSQNHKNVYQNKQAKDQ